MSGTGSSTILPAVEQRIGSSSQPLEGAGFDPAFIPGLTPPPPSATPDDPGAVEEAHGLEAGHAPEGAEAGEAAEAPADAAEPGDAPDTGEPGEPGEAAEAVEEDQAGDADGEPALSGPDDGPVFEAADHRATVVADHTGITLRADGMKAELRWDEIGAVEIGTPRFGKRLGITVHMLERRTYQGDVEAPSRAVLKQWARELDAVLDAHFDEGTDGADGKDEPEPPAAPAADGEETADGAADDGQAVAGRADDGEAEATAEKAEAEAGASSAG